MKVILSSVVILVCITLVTPAHGQENLSVMNGWSYYADQPASFYKYLCEKGFGQLERRKELIQKLKSREAWLARQAVVRSKMQKVFGTFPQRTPLNAVITGTLQREDVYVEKLYFESLPGYYVTAALFLPAGKRENLPAIVYCSGHSENGFRSETYQHIILNYVKKGFAVLAFDPIGQGERKQYLRQDSTSRFGSTHEHSYPGSQAFVAGISPANFFIWDGIRAVDYLVSRKEIDRKRIGIAGRSGGGTQSTYIAAMDERIVAAAPECYITSFDRLLRSRGPQDAEQNPIHFLAEGLDITDLVEVRAPKPTLIVSTTQDIFSIEGTREVVEEAKRAYRALGKEDNLTLTEDDAGHASTQKNREASYAFFQKHLNNPGSSEDLKVIPFREDELFVTPQGKVYTSLKGEDLFALVQKYALKKFRENGQSPVNPAELRQRVMSITGYEKRRNTSKEIFSGRLHRATYAIEKYLVKGPGDYFLPVLWLKPHAGKGKVVCLLDDRGKETACKKAEIADRLALAGYEVVVPDLNGTGELSASYLKGGDAVIEGTPMNLWYMGILVNKSLVGVHVEEIKLLLDFVKARTPDAQKISAIGSGTLTTDLLHASLILNEFDKLALLHPILSFRSVIEHREYLPRFISSVVAGALPYYDLPNVVAALAPRPILMQGVVDAQGALPDKNHIAALYKDLSGTNRLEINQLEDDSSRLDALLDWLKD